MGVISEEEDVWWRGPLVDGSHETVCDDTVDVADTVNTS